MKNLIELPKNHFIFTSSKDVNDICFPLKQFKINGFCLLRSFPDGTQIKLSNNARWQEHIFKQGLHQNHPFSRHPKKYMPGVYLWDSFSNQEMVIHARKYFNFDHGITIINKFPDGTAEYCGFSSEPGNAGITEFFLNNLDLLYRFILYFKDRAADLIEKSAKSYRLILPEQKNIEKERFLSKGDYYALAKEFEHKIKLNHYEFNYGELKGIRISRRELDCVKYLLQNRAAKEIAELLFISTRTVEKHLDNLKIKLNCESKQNLYEKLKRSEINFTGLKLEVM